MKEKSSTMLEKGTWPYSSSNNGHFESASGSANEKNMTSNCLDACSIATIGDEMFDADLVLTDHTAKVDSNSYHYSLTPPVGDLSFMDSEQVEKGDGDLMFYNWPEIESFEDIDKMFRSCDSTFGFGIDNVDDLGWFSSANGSEGSDDPLKPSFAMPCANFVTLGSASEHDGAFRMLDNVGPSHDETNKILAPNSETSSSRRSDVDDSTVSIFSSSDGGGMPFFIDDTQNISLEAQLKTQNPSKVEKEDNYQEKDFNNIIQPDGSNLVVPSLFPSIVKSEDNGLPVSLQESSDASNQKKLVQRIHGFVEGKKKGFLEQNGFPASETDHEMSVVTSDPVIVQNQGASFESGIEGQSESNANGVTSFPAKFDTSNLQESSCLSSVPEEVSFEASSFRQLQNVMEKLDIKTKLCIRDSLYRLARSAEQKHNYPDRRGGIRFDKDGDDTLVPDEADKCSGLMDIEADTNPIDRKIAHLLFHRPSYSSKPLAKAQKSNNAPALVVEKSVSQEESSGAVAK